MGGYCCGAAVVRGPEPLAAHAARVLLVALGWGGFGGRGGAGRGPALTSPYPNWCIQVEHATVLSMHPRPAPSPRYCMTRARMPPTVPTAPQGGDITRIAATKGGQPIGDLVVSDVIHKTYIKVGNISLLFFWVGEWVSDLV